MDKIYVQMQVVDEWQLNDFLKQGYEFIATVVNDIPYNHTDYSYPAGTNGASVVTGIKNIVVMQRVTKFLMGRNDTARTLYGQS